MPAIHRRNFLQSSGRAAVAMTAASYSQIQGANDRLEVACIGVRGRGRNHIEQFGQLDGTEIAAVVDIDQAVAERAGQYALDFQDRKPAEYEDLRKMLEDKSIHIVTIATRVRRSPSKVDEYVQLVESYRDDHGRSRSTLWPRTRRRSKSNCSSGCAICFRCARAWTIVLPMSR